MRTPVDSPRIVFAASALVMVGACLSYAGSALHVPRPLADAAIRDVYLPIERAFAPMLAQIPFPLALVPMALFLVASVAIAATRNLHARIRMGHALSFALVAAGVALCATCGTLERSRTDVRSLIGYSADRVTPARREAFERYAIVRAGDVAAAAAGSHHEFVNGAGSEYHVLRAMNAPLGTIVPLKRFHTGLTPASEKAVTVPALESYELVEPPRYAREFITLHENAHLAGFERESDANVIAFFSATTSSDARAAYQAWILLASTLAAESTDVAIRNENMLVRNDIFAGRLLLLGFDAGVGRLDYNAFADVIVGGDPAIVCRIDANLCAIAHQD